MSEMGDRIARLETKINYLESENTARKNENARLSRRLDEEVSNISLQMQNLMKRVERSVRR